MTPRTSPSPLGGREERWREEEGGGREGGGREGRDGIYIGGRD